MCTVKGAISAMLACPHTAYPFHNCRCGSLPLPMPYIAGPCDFQEACDCQAQVRAYVVDALVSQGRGLAWCCATPHPAACGPFQEDHQNIYYTGTTVLSHRTSIIIT